VFPDPFALFQGAVYHERVRAVIRELAGARFRTRDLRFTSPAGVVSTASRALNARSLIPPSLRAVRRDVPFFTSPADAVVAINDFRPEVLSATYGSYLEELFVHVHRSGETLHQPTVVTYGGDSLSDPVRRLIMEHYGIPVVSVYGAVEAFDIGFECERHLGHHLNLDLYPLRVVDAEGRELPDGRSGNVVVSSLVGRGTVILNYRLGDIAAKLPIDCPCGRSLPLLSFIEGREDDSLRSANGESIDSRAVRTLFKGEEQIARYRVVQEAPTQVAVFLVTLEASKPEGLVHRLACKLQDRFGARTRIEISFVDSFPRTRRGKVRTIESLL
jgi:phenylacetate-CoA ligase